MERKTHILFTITWIYWLGLLLKKYNIESDLAMWYIFVVSSFPLISIPYQVIVTSLPDSDLYNSRLNKTVLAPAIWILSFFVKHRWFTHRIEGIIFFSILMLFLYIIWTNIIILAILSFLSVTIIWVLIDDLKINILWIKIRKIWIGKNAIYVDKKFIDKLLSTLIIVFFPILLIPEVYKLFLVSLILAYIFHMIWDAFSKEWWTITKIPFSDKKIKFQMPKFLAFRVWWSFERKFIKPILWFTLFFIVIIDYKFWGEKLISETIINFNQINIIYNNPNILIEDLENTKERFNNILNFIKNVSSKIN